MGCRVGRDFGCCARTEDSQREKGEIAGWSSDILQLSLAFRAFSL